MQTNKKSPKVKTPKVKMPKAAEVIEDEYSRNMRVLRMALRVRVDFQKQRTRMDNRIGRKADGESQDIAERPFTPKELTFFTSVSDLSKKLEEDSTKQLDKLLTNFPIYNEWLKGVKGVGPVIAAHIIANIDIHEATTVSKIWQYCGLNPGMVRAQTRNELGDGKFELVKTNKMIRGDKPERGYVMPYNKELKTALLGVMGTSFLQQKNQYYTHIYVPTKHRLENSSDLVSEIPKRGAEPVLVMWKDAKPAHRDRAAIRKMVKQFLADLYVAWRTIEGLEVRKPYQEAYLGHKHSA